MRASLFGVSVGRTEKEEKECSAHVRRSWSKNAVKEKKNNKCGSAEQNSMCHMRKLPAYDSSRRIDFGLSVQYSIRVHK